MLASDEEVDIHQYQQYLGAQSDYDLVDITQHLDRVASPRRREAAEREMVRRRVMAQPRYTEQDNLWRNFTLLAILLMACTFLLAITMSPDEAVAPQPPPSFDYDTSGGLSFTGGVVQETEGARASIIGVYVAQAAENQLRSAVLLLSRTGVYLLVALIITWRLILCAVSRRSQSRVVPTELYHLYWIALAGEGVVLLAAGLTNVPLLLNGGADVSGGLLARAVTLLAPWG